MEDHRGLEQIFRALREGRLEDLEAVLQIAALRKERAREELHRSTERAVAGGRLTVVRAGRD